jgi:outer membrane protein TolC
MRDRRRSAVRFWPGVALALLAGCQALAPPREPVVAPTVSARASFGAPATQPALPPNVLPVGLDTVFRLAHDQNGQLRIARARLDEAVIGQDLAQRAWLPQVTIGPAYFRHEGGIQDFQGNLVHSSYGSVLAGVEVCSKLDPREVAFQRVDAERKVWQQKGELSKLTSEKLLDAASTYIDLLATRASEALSLAIEKQLTDLLEQANILAKVDPGLRVEVERVETELRGHRLIQRKLREGGDAAAAKLAYLLGVDPHRILMPIETHLVPLRLVDARQPIETLVDRALRQGPGVRELEGLLHLIDQTRAAAEGPGRLLPALEVNCNEGAFGAGPGARMNWDNQFNIGMSLRWNLTEAVNAKDRLRQADAQAAQVHLSHHELQAKLTLGVTEARTTILSSEDQLPLAQEQIRHAEKSYEISASRLKESIKGRSPSEVLQATRALGGARLQLIQTLRDLDKAQVRLLVLTGERCP